MQIRILAIAFFITSQSIYSQVNIQISVKQTHSKLAKLFLCQQVESRLVDSSKQISPGVFKFSLPANHEQGLYKFSIGKNIDFDFVVTAEPRITLETIVFAAEDSVKSMESRENEVYFQYQKIKKRLSQQAWFLSSLIDYYSDSSIFCKQLYLERYKVQRELFNASMSLAINNPTLFTSNLIRLELKPIPEIGITPDERKNFLKQRWWVDANLRDIRFTNSLALESKLWGFIELYIENGYDREQQDSAFVAGAKAVMTLNAALAIRGYFRSILIKSYLDSDYDAVTKYLYETPFDSLAPLKLTPEEKNSYEIQGKNRVGTKANDMRFATIDGATLKLSKINARFKLVFFWSMWCPHCTEMLPELYRTYLKYKGNGFEVIAISIDDEIDGWRKFVNERKQSWINTIEPDNGKSKIVSGYNVDGIPKLFLLDENMTIISRPSNVKQLEAKLKGILH